MPRAGPACMTCREKCRKCDRGRPSCQRCISKGLVCQGYPDQFRFCGIASRGKWKNARIPVSEKIVQQVNLNPVSLTAAQSMAVTPAATIISGGSLTPPTPASVTRRSKRMTIESVLEKQVPEVGDDIKSLLAAEQTKTLLHHYDTFMAPHQIAELGDEKDNPYRAYILPLAKKQIGLLYAVLGLAAVHLGKLTDDTTLVKATSVEYRVKAIRALSEKIRKGQNTSLSDEEEDGVFATIQILLLHDIAETGISEHGIHITGAMSVCKSILISEGFNGRRQRAVFFIGNLAWLDIIRAFAGTRRLCFTQDFREMIATASGHRFELVNGCPREIFLIIGRVLDKAKEYKMGWTTDEDFRSTLMSAKFELHAWDAKSKTYPSSDPRWISVAIAFQFACILHIHRLLNPSQPASSPEIQTAVHEILDATADIPSDCTLIELMILPLFMAGADSLSRHSQYYVLARFREIERRSEMRNPVPADLLKQVWAARAAQGASHEHEGNISWRDFTCCPELPRQHDYLII
ncbi:fungal-specific transcription factor domain-containing protein [Aspergillus pseudoustus]|uniref:Fungal-specific transcription factor domain-containing protein n=1 Tax=Aspergillus pseudoustus TaxID=1810923 RepID=A0ABR4KYY0_9EURO